MASSPGTSPTLFGEGRRASPYHGRSPAEELVMIRVASLLALVISPADTGRGGLTPLIR